MRPLPGGGYEVDGAARPVAVPVPPEASGPIAAQNVIFAGGVLGTVELLLRLKESPDGLPSALRRARRLRAHELRGR